MPIDPNIAMRYQPIQMPSETNALAKLQQLQAGQQAQQLNALKMDAAQKEMQNAALDRTMKLYSDAISRAPNKDAAGKLVRRMFEDPVVGQHWQKFGTVEDAVSDIPSDKEGFSRWQLMFGGATPLQAETLDVRRQELESARKTADAARMKTALDYYDKTGQMLPGFAGAGTGNVLNMPIGDMGAGGKLPTPAPIPDVASTADASNQYSPATQRAIDKAVAIENAKQINRQKLTPQQETKLKSDIGKDRQAAITNIDAMDDVLSAINDLRKSDTTGGLKGATGYMSYVPSLPEGEAATAETRLENLKGKVTALGKAVQSSTGKIGSIATQEWKILRDTVAALDAAIPRGREPTLEEIKKIEDFATRAKENLANAFETTHGDNLSRFPEMALPGGNGGVIDFGSLK